MPCNVRHLIFTGAKAYFTRFDRQKPIATPINKKQKGET